MPDQAIAGVFIIYADFMLIYEVSYDLNHFIIYFILNHTCICIYYFVASAGIKAYMYFAVLYSHRELSFVSIIPGGLHADGRMDSYTL
ncbi:hypothetical protein SDC9_110772 [bioreactor metagenome]|uniref:Uncharacterized protein n=1 Tax=bioreactor metagenome TaxID=1076179 RepID=A0A645BFP4_9ZZZZ